MKQIATLFLCLMIFIICTKDGGVIKTREIEYKAPRSCIICSGEKMNDVQDRSWIRIRYPGSGIYKYIPVSNISHIIVQSEKGD